jgi:hypothetical protein
LPVRYEMVHVKPTVRVPNDSTHISDTPLEEKYNDFVLYNDKDAGAGFLHNSVEKLYKRLTSE